MGNTQRFIYNRFAASLHENELRPMGYDLGESLSLAEASLRIGVLTWVLVLGLSLTLLVLGLY